MKNSGNSGNEKNSTKNTPKSDRSRCTSLPEEEKTENLLLVLTNINGLFCFLNFFVCMAAAAAAAAAVHKRIKFILLVVHMFAVNIS